MSLTSKIVLGGACLTSAAIIGYVHFKQKFDRERLHDGVIRDIERQKNKAEGLYSMQKNRDLETDIKNFKRTEELKGEMSLSRTPAS